MPPAGDQPTDRHRLVRLFGWCGVRCGSASSAVPLFDYARDDHATELFEEGAVFRSPGIDVTVHLARYR